METSIWYMIFYWIVWLFQCFSWPILTSCGHQSLVSIWNTYQQKERVNWSLFKTGGQFAIAINAKCCSMYSLIVCLCLLLFLIFYSWINHKGTSKNNWCIKILIIILASVVWLQYVQGFWGKHYHMCLYLHVERRIVANNSYFIYAAHWFLDINLVLTNDNTFAKLPCCGPTSVHPISVVFSSDSEILPFSEIDFKQIWSSLKGFLSKRFSKENFQQNFDFIVGAFYPRLELFLVLEMAFVLPIDWEGNGLHSWLP